MADLNEKGLFASQLEDKHRSAVSIRTRHTDNLSRESNREWLRVLGMKFVRRWAIVSCIAWAAAWAVSGMLILEVPLVLLGIVAGVIAMFFQYLRSTATS